MAHSVKEDLIGYIQTLPDNITMEDVMYHLYVRETILQRMEDVKNNPSELLTEEDVENQIIKWNL